MILSNIVVRSVGIYPLKTNDKCFTKFINKKCLEKVVELFEEKLEQTNARQLSNSWEEFNRRVSQEMYPIIHFDYDVFIPDD